MQTTNRPIGVVSQPRIATNEVIGESLICAWQPVPGVTWIQTCSAQFARKLAQRRDSRLVVRGFAGGYLRTLEFYHSLAWANRLINRYTRHQIATNGVKIVPALATAGRSLTEGAIYG
jgi:hypothetical protein